MTGAHTLESIANHSRTIQGVWASDVKAGDWLVVRTKNSLYTLTSVGDGRFQIAGGWFATHEGAARVVRILGCTWGGRAILTDMLAAPGMFIEFDNGVQTTRVQNVRLLRCPENPTTH